MRDDQKNTVPKKEEGRQHEVLKFFFTPMDAPRPDRENPHAKDATWVPEVIDALRGQFGDAIGEVGDYAGEHTVYIRRDRFFEAVTYLKEELQFNYFVACGAIDRFVEDERFEVFYNLVSLTKGKRIRVMVRLEEDDPVIPSLTPLYRAANWHERETYDMMGIRFEGHPDLRRMFMPEDFEYFPQRKEFPQLGVPGSLPLPSQVPEGDIIFDPFPAAHGHKPPKSYQEPVGDDTKK